MKESKLIRGIVDTWLMGWVGHHWVTPGCGECLNRLVWGLRA